MNRDPAIVLDIVIACRKLVVFVAGRSRDDLDQDLMLQYAVLHAIAIVGEAANRLSAEFGEAHPAIPWKEIIGTRNRIILGYSDVKLDISGISLPRRFIPCSRNSNPCSPSHLRHPPDGPQIDSLELEPGEPLCLIFGAITEGRSRMSATITIDEAQANLRELIRQLTPGQEVVITKNQQPVAKLVSEPTKTRPGLRPPPGLRKGYITVVSDDDEHLKDFEEYMP